MNAPLPQAGLRATLADLAFALLAPIAGPVEQSGGP